MNKIVNIKLALAFSLALTPGMVNSQEAGVQLEEVVVYGQKLANLRAIDAKRNSDRVLDAISADDIGSLPDFNVGEAAQRIPGVTITNDQAEARFIAIRALNPDYNYMTIDGSSFAVPDRDGRRPFQDVIPSSLVSRIEVIKTLTPDVEGSAIGGIVNLVSRSAFDFEDTFFKVTAQTGRYENDVGYEGDGLSGNSDVVFANTFGESDQFGFVLTGNYYKRDSYIPQVEYGSSRSWFDADNADPVTGQFARTEPYGGGGEGFEVPSERRWYWYHNERQRYGASAKFEYQPDDNQYNWLQLIYNTARDDEARQTDLLRLNGGNAVSQTRNADGSVTSVIEGNTRHDVYLGQFDFERTLFSATAGGEYTLSNDANLKVVGTYSRAEFDNPEFWTEWRQDQGTASNFSVTSFGGSDYDFDITNPALYNDLSTYEPNRARALDSRQLEEDVYEFSVDYGVNNESGSVGWGYKVGAKYRNVERVFNEDGERYVPVNSSTSTYTLGASGTILDLGLCPPGCSADDTLFTVDPTLAFTAFDAHLAANPDQWRIDSQDRNDNRRDYSFNEDVLAGYGLMTHRGDRHSVIFGLRYEDTNWDAVGRGRRNGVYGDTQGGGSYYNFLPSINFTYEINDDVRAVLAYSHALGRPEYSDLAPRDDTLTETNGEFFLNRNNPNLEARKSRNYDLSIEWYFDDDQGILSAGVFYKTLIDELLSITSESVPVVFNGENVVADVTQEINSDTDINIIGVELAFIKNLTFLPGLLDGLGVSANATWLDSDFRVQNDSSADTVGVFNEPGLLEGMAKKNYNAAIFYDQGPFSARLAYNYTGLKLSSRINVGTPYRSRYDTPKEKIDFQASYAVSDHWKVSLNVLNLTGEGRGEVLGRGQELNIVEADFGKAVFLGFSYNM